ncbi:tachykinin-3a [Thunnus maccoyii]|uniref:tachykinin-3a n=1 Tax=Thunnus maccoyii TaxID=8240 RepID=UPI001C4BCF3A|nr:tachykinin-3a [Thunnus maccoyii]
MIYLFQRTQLIFSLSARQKTGGAEKMGRGLLLVTLFLIMKLQYSQSRCEEPGSRRSTSDQTLGVDNPKRNILKRYNDLDYDSFVGLMGRRNADTNAVQAPQKREMQDIFVGLMGRRNSEPDNGPWRREYPERRGIFLNKCRLRFLQGL